MDIAKYRCLKCRQSQLEASDTGWMCAHCGQRYPCVSGIPNLLLEDKLGARDKVLRQTMYDGIFGLFYRRMMPFITLPVRPLRQAWPDWILYLAVSAFLIGLSAYLVHLVVSWRPASWTLMDFVLVLIGTCIVVFFQKHRYLLNLFIIAISARISLCFTKFTPKEDMREIHARLIGELMSRNSRLKVLDVCTGTCASLYKHGWIKLDAEFTGIDLSETMLLQGRDFMAGKRVAIELALADVANLPFQSEIFDVVLNYGAINGVSDAAAALREMERVAKKGGLIFFLDEQLYEGASPIERWYFRNVLSSHNVIHECPVDLVPANLHEVKVHQVYHFYYICTAQKT